MPNHVTTRCIVRANNYPAAVRAFRQTCIILQADPERQKDKPTLRFDFQSIIPMPEILRDATNGTTQEFGAILVMAAAESRGPYGAHLVLIEKGIPDTWIAAWTKEMVAAGKTPPTATHTFAKLVLEMHPDFREEGRKRLLRIAETDYADWYQWSIDHWGTKWGAYQFCWAGEPPEHLDANPVEFTFQTAWSFPTPIFQRLTEMFPDLTFECWTHDEGDNFAGQGLFGRGAEENPFTIGEATDALYERVHGEPRPKYEDEETA